MGTGIFSIKFNNRRTKQGLLPLLELMKTILLATSLSLGAPEKMPVPFYFAISVSSSTVVADSESDVSPNLWQQPVKGVSVALALRQTTKNGTQKNVIRVYVKNTSTATEYLPDNINDRAIQIFYVSSNGKQIPLRDYSVKVPDDVSMPAMPDARPFKPGEVGIRVIDLTPSELALVKVKPVFCRFDVSDQQSGGFHPVESSPQQLTETVEPTK